MLRFASHGLNFLAFGNLAALPWLKQAVLTRQGPYGADWTMGPSEEGGPPGWPRAALFLETELGFPPMAVVGQVHGPKALVLSTLSGPYAPKSQSEVLEGYDAIIGGPGTSMMIRVADCQGAILVDPKTRLTAVVHSGWRGSAQNILGRTVAAMEGLGASPPSMLAAIGPSLGPCCAEMVNYREELPEELWPFTAEKPSHFDFWAISRHQLEKAGLLAGNIEVSGLCSKCDPWLYSHRRGDKGRFAVVAGVLA
jgi:YfiH family protein